MYRLLSAKSASGSNLKLFSQPKYARERQIWVFTNGLRFWDDENESTNGNLMHNTHHNQVRHHQSITPNAELYKLLKRRNKPKNKKWIELLQITKQATKETRTSVKNLKSKSLTDFIDNNEKKLSPLNKNKQYDKRNIQSSSSLMFNNIEYQKVDLEMLGRDFIPIGMFDDVPLIFFGKEVNHEIIKLTDPHEILESFQHFKAVTEQNEMNEIELVTEEPALEDFESEILDIESMKAEEKVVKSKKKIVKDHRYKLKQHRSAEHERLAKQKSLLCNLSSYLDVCVSNGMVNRGLSTLHMYRHRYNESNNAAQIIDIELYNILLHGYAEKGNYEKIKEICRILSEDNIKYNPQTFAAIFECLGRLKHNEENIKNIEFERQTAERMGITFNVIMDKGKFLFDQREVVLDAIRRVEPQFEPVYCPTPLKYCNRLLTELDEHVRNIDDKIGTDHDTSGNVIMNPKKGFKAIELREMARKQLEAEVKGTVVIKSIERVKELGNAELSRKKIDDLQNVWKSQICAAFNRDLNTLKVQNHYKSNRFMTHFTYLKSLDTGQCADILLQEIRMLAEGSDTFSPTIGQLYKQIGHKVQMRYQIEQKKKNGILEKTGEIYAAYCEELETSDTNDNSRQSWQRIVHRNRNFGPSMDINETVWPLNVTMGVGKFMYNILMRDIKIDANILRSNSKSQKLLPAFYTLFRNHGRVVKQEVKPHPILSKLFRSSQQQTLAFEANLVPMLCPPQPWSTVVNGGYLLTKSELIRLPQQAIQQWTRINESNPQEIYPALDSLNQLASIPWKVNTDVLDVVINVFNDGGDSKLDVPQPPSSLKPPTAEKGENLSNKEKFHIFRQKLIHRRKQGEMYSLWCDTLYRLSLANHYRDKVFWLPHNMDFRGRVYPLPPHLNHLGSDLARSLLVFHQAQPLGTDGFSWLKLHCINLTGLKKRDSIRERLLYAEEVMDDIIDSADNPMTGRMWWTKSDEPWQTLACCMEIAKVSRCAEPEKYMSRFPIHQDGSCNGLQHYAALGRDKSGATSVNLSPSSVPQDVYSAVAALVENSRAADAENGSQVAQILQSFVRRKVIKQTVMTTVYGVTRYGARLQIAKQLKDIENFPKEWVWPASTYLTTKTFESLREMFTSTKQIQDWFTDCARLISGVCTQNVEWITPLGLPIVQPYSRNEAKSLQKLSSKIDGNNSMDMYEKPNVLKQKNAFPPNFIHSLDSSHMMLTSLYSERKGITFISVHDCFWTHACTVPDMNKICREQFVALHSLPILEDLSKFLVQKYSYSERDLKNDGSQVDLTRHKLNKTLQQVPSKGDFDLNDVLKSIYFFS